MAHATGSSHVLERPRDHANTLIRFLVGGIWVAGAAWNAFVTWSMTDPYSWLADDSVIPLWRWFFTDIVERQPDLWTALLIAGEVTLGLLTLGRNRWARMGLLGGALFSLLLFSLGTLYTLMMGPYALLLIWLSRHEHHRSVRDLMSLGLPPAH
jgi:hypothetical protein